MAPRPIVRALSFATFAPLVAWALYAVYLTLTRPVERVAEAGFVYPMPAHGPPVFISALDIAILVGLLALSFVAGFASEKLSRKTTPPS